MMPANGAERHFSRENRCWSHIHGNRRHYFGRMNRSQIIINNGDRIIARRFKGRPGEPRACRPESDDQNISITEILKNKLLLFYFAISGLRRNERIRLLQEFMHS